MTISDNGPFSHASTPDAAQTSATPNRDRPRESVLINSTAESLDEPLQKTSEPIPPESPDKEAKDHKPSLAPLIALIAISLIISLINGYVPYTGSPETKELAERVKAIEADPAAKTNSAQLGKLEQRLAAIENRTDSKPFISAEMMSAFETKLANAEAQIKSTIASGEANQLEAKRLAQALSELSLASNKNNSASTQMDSSLMQLSQRLAQIETILSAPKSQTRVNEDTFEPSNTALTDVIRIFLAQSLAQSLDQSRPNQRLIEALKQNGLTQDKVQILMRLADPAASDLRQLKETFSNLAPSLLNTQRMSEENNLLDKLMNSAARLVKITPVQEMTGKESASLIPRIEADLARNHLSEALLKWRDLPESTRKLSADWQAQADLHLQAQIIADDLINESLERLGRTSK